MLLEELEPDADLPIVYDILRAMLKKGPVPVHLVNLDDFAFSRLTKLYVEDGTVMMWWQGAKYDDPKFHRAGTMEAGCEPEDLDDWKLIKDENGTLELHL
jgi:hypothetical protein